VFLFNFKYVPCYLLVTVVSTHVTASTAVLRSLCLLFAGLLLDFLADAEYPDPPNFFRRRKSAGEKCCCRKHRQIRKIGSAAAKTSANLQLNLPFLLSLKLHNSRAGFKRGIWVCLRNGSTGNVSETHETGSATYLHLVFSVLIVCLAQLA